MAQRQELSDWCHSGAVLSLHCSPAAELLPGAGTLVLPLGAVGVAVPGAHPAAGMGNGGDLTEG